MGDIRWSVGDMGVVCSSTEGPMTYIAVGPTIMEVTKIDVHAAGSSTGGVCAQHLFGEESLPQKENDARINNTQKKPHTCIYIRAHTRTRNIGLSPR